MAQDSTGNPIHVGDKVRFRGREYTIKSFTPCKGRLGICAIEFQEPVHTSEVPDEIGVDKL